MTDNAPARIDRDKHLVERTVLIRASRSAVWDAITVPELMSEWFGETASFTPLAPGTVGSIGWADYGECPIRIEGIDPESRFSFRWGTPDRELSTASSTLVAFELFDAAGGTELRVTESGFDSRDGDTEESLESNRGGWDAELDELVALLERQDSQ